MKLDAHTIAAERARIHRIAATTSNNRHRGAARLAIAVLSGILAEMGRPRVRAAKGWRASA